MKKDKSKEIMQPINEKIKISDFNEDEGIIKKFIITVIAIGIILVGIYAITEMLNKKNNNSEDKITDGVINYDKVSVGTILNRPNKDYYVLVYNAEDSKAVLYSTILTNYMKKNKEDNYVKIYFCDLDNSLNNKFYNVNNDNTSNPKASQVEEFDFGELTLLKIKEGKVEKYIEDFDSIKEILK